LRYAIDLSVTYAACERSDSFVRWGSKVTTRDGQRGSAGSFLCQLRCAAHRRTRYARARRTARRTLPRSRITGPGSECLTNVPAASTISFELASARESGFCGGTIGHGHLASQSITPRLPYNARRRPHTSLAPSMLPSASSLGSPVGRYPAARSRRYSPP